MTRGRRPSLRVIGDCSAFLGNRLEESSRGAAAALHAGPRSLPKDRHESVNGFGGLLVGSVPGDVKNYMPIGGEDTVRPYVALLPRRAGVKIGNVQANGLLIPDVSTGDLAEDDIIAAECRENQSRPTPGLGQIREGKRHDDDIALYKSCQASSSSGRSQSLARLRSLARAVGPPCRTPCCLSDST